MKRGLSAVKIRRACDNKPPTHENRLHRSLSNAPHRPRNAVGRNLAGDGSARSAGQNHLRRQQQFRRLAHRQAPAKPPQSGDISWGWSASRANTAWPPGRWRWMCCPPAGSMAWASSPGARWTAAFWAAATSETGTGRRAGDTFRNARTKSAPNWKNGKISAKNSAKSPADVASPGYWPIPSVTAPIIGPRTMDQFDAGPRTGDPARRARNETTQRNLARPRRRSPRSLRLVITKMHYRKLGNQISRSARSASAPGKSVAISARRTMPKLSAPSHRLWISGSASSKHRPRLWRWPQRKTHQPGHQRQARDKLTIASKIPPKRYKRHWPQSKQSETFPEDWIIQCTEQSLANLKIDCLDVQQLHAWTEHYLKEPQWLNALEKLQKTGQNQIRRRLRQ